MIIIIIVFVIIIIIIIIIIKRDPNFPREKFSWGQQSLQKYKKNLREGEGDWFTYVQKSYQISIIFLFYICLSVCRFVKGNIYAYTLYTGLSCLN